MKKAVSFLVLIASLVSPCFAGDFYRYSPQAERIVQSDLCAQRAVEAVAGVIIEEIKEAGADIPDFFMIKTIEVIDQGRTYSVRIAGSPIYLAQTRIYGRGCKVIREPVAKRR